VTPPPAADNSRETAARAGWRAPQPKRPYGAAWEDLFARRKRTRWGNFFWISPAPLLASMNDKVVKGLDDLVNEVRPRWVAAQRAAGRLDQGLAVHEHAGKERFSFLIIGDPGEQDASQYAVVEPLLEVGDDTEFALIASDVIYPAGDINEYIDGFYLPFERYRHPIYALPGNHDWYDGLNGFMFHFCDAQPLPPVAYRAGSYTWKERLAHTLWRKPSAPDLPVLLYERKARAQLMQEREDAVWEPPQPAPYFAIETKRLLIVCIDTGITGKLDREQGEWLRLVSGDPRPKLLVTGKPLYVDGEYRPGEIDWGPDNYPGVSKEVGRFRTVDDVVREPSHRYVAAIGGDVHNYQRYSVLLNDEGPPGGWSPTSDEGPPPGPNTPPQLLRRLEYIVSGGGGAYMSATHRFGRVRLDPADNANRSEDEKLPTNIARITEDDFWCYPLRGDSLARFARRFVPGYGWALLGTWLFVAILLALFFVPLDGLDQRLEHLDNAKATNALWVVPVTLGLATGVTLAAVTLSNWIAPKGSRSLTATTFGAAGAVLLVWAGNQVFGQEWDAWIWELMLSSVIAIALPVVALVGYFLLRDFLPESVRAGIGLAIGIAFLAGWIGSRVSIEAEEPLLVGASLGALWASVVVIGLMRELPDDPKQTERFWTKVRMRAGQLIPIGSGVAGVVLALAASTDAGWVTTGVLTALAATLFLLAAVALLLGLLGLPTLYALGGPADPDKTARWLADRIGVEPVRTAAQQAKPDLKTKVLSALTYWSEPYRRVMSELAEATTPPFFKNFLRIDVGEDELTITAYGVSGWPEDEHAPTVEDRVTIPLA
jgi:MFS family permease